MSQQKVIEQLLETGEWVEMPEFIRHFITKGATIISTMIHKQGWKIAKERVPGKPYFRYKLISRPTVFGLPIKVDRSLKPSEVMVQQPRIFSGYDESSHLKPNGKRK